MANLYDRIRPQDKRPARAHRLRLIIPILISITILALVAGLFLNAILYQWRWRGFMSNLSNSTYYAYENNSLRASVQGQPDVQVSGENIYRLYAYITTFGPGREEIADIPPEAALLDYGDGSRLWVWSVALDYAAELRGNGLFLVYEAADGSRYSYNTAQLDFDSISRHFSPERNPIIGAN